METNNVKSAKPGGIWKLFLKIDVYTKWITSEKFWIGFAILTVCLVFIASILWMKDHPFGISWDEAEYFDRILADIQRIRTGGIGHYIKSLLTEDTIRPPAYRFLALPFVLIFGFSSLNVRLVSLSFFVISLRLVYRLVSRVSCRIAGAFAVIFLTLCPYVVFLSMNFGTEYPLFLATTAMLYFLFRSWNGQPEHNRDWIGLGLSLGLGALAKTSFAMLAGPMLAITLYLSWRKVISEPNFKYLGRAILVGVLIALPWWIFNGRSALWYAHYASTLKSDSLGNSIIEVLPKWLKQLSLTSLGPSLSILIILILILLIVEYVKKARLSYLDHFRKALLWIFPLSCLPLPIFQLIARNGNPRYLTPVLFVLAAGLGIMVGTKGWMNRRFFAIGASVLFGIQLSMIIYPASQLESPSRPQVKFEKPPWQVMVPVEQWDWEALRDVANLYQIDSPCISFLGNARELNWPSIAYPWLLHNQEVGTINWLWQYGDGPINWEKTIELAEDSDMVLTIVNNPAFKDIPDNQYNYEFVERLENNPKFQFPIHLIMGRFERTDIVVFVNKSASTVH